MDGFQSTLFGRVEPIYSSSIQKGFRELLQNKHLYQNHRIEPPSIQIVYDAMEELLLGSTEPIGDNEITETCEFVYSSFPQVEWKIKNPHGRRSLPFATQSDNNYISLTFSPPTLKLFCGSCKRKEAYNFLRGNDLLEEIRGPEVMTGTVEVQVFSFAYQCQACKGTPEILIVRRNNLKLIKSGRTPMEEIEIASCIPKNQKKHYSDAIIAFNSGQVLAGNFLLRTFIEQYVRSKSSTPTSQNIDALFLEYSENFPDDFKQRFPSLQSIYDRLSEDLHGATASEDVFIEERDNIEKHFRAKEVFEIIN